ncbi:MAG: hypothetical protein ACC742_14810 [Thermoanaerobaculales bacterium]
MTSGVPAPLAVVLEVIDLLVELKVRYHLGGSFASAVHGVPRQTMDADLVVDLDLAGATMLVGRLRDRFYVDPEIAKDAVSRRGSFNAIHLATGFKVDFFVKGTGGFDDMEFERSELKQIVNEPPRSVFVKTAEDTILRKLQWYVSGGGVSDRQWRDVLGVIMTGGEDIDRDYLGVWADRLDLGDVLNRALNEAGEA